MHVALWALAGAAASAKLRWLGANAALIHSRGPSVCVSFRSTLFMEHFRKQPQPKTKPNLKLVINTKR